MTAVLFRLLPYYFKSSTFLQIIIFVIEVNLKPVEPGHSLLPYVNKNPKFWLGAKSALKKKKYF